ncbi:hypothetical protein [Pedobacter cryophilus]|uniref:Outer membrane protein beta-barrel domain-containing protein n=1 Tax=Pedobacter cryophilus TaxID=2571271 RepID=A0A4U1C0F9_9SPHI|nr:hypothetical protein [Pedobacter cryophilus]TKB98681.1 hypothetical protein FA046_06070 [Pedobacter cryophilus]
MKKNNIVLLLLLISFTKIRAQESSDKPNSYINFNIGSFINLGSSINSLQTNKIFEEFNTPGVQAGLSYEVEKKHLLFSGGISLRIVPYGYKGTIQLKDLQPNNERFGYFFANSRYVYFLPSLPFKITYQTNPNLANQRFWFSAGVELNFSNTKEDNYSVSYNPTNSNQPTNLLIFNSASQKQTFLALNIGTGITKIQKNGDQLRFGLNFNGSYVATALIKGDYIVNLKDETITGTYLSNGSYLGVTIAYAYKTKKD